jgi:hypothetical protein
MQYTLSLTTRMMALVAFCLAMLAVLLFVAGIEIGRRMAAPAEQPGVAAGVRAFPSIISPARGAASAASAAKP